MSREGIVTVIGTSSKSPQYTSHHTLLTRLHSTIHSTYYTVYSKYYTVYMALYTTLHFHILVHNTFSTIVPTKLYTSQHHQIAALHFSKVWRSDYSVLCVCQSCVVGNVKIPHKHGIIQSALNYPT